MNKFITKSTSNMLSLLYICFLLISAFFYVGAFLLNNRWNNLIPPVQFIHAIFGWVMLIGSIGLLRKKSSWAWITFSAGVFGLIVFTAILSTFIGLQYLLVAFSCSILWIIHYVIRKKRTRTVTSN